MIENEQPEKRYEVFQQKSGISEINLNTENKFPSR
jgi:hypothetical protein